MNTFTKRIEIDAPLAEVWATLADIGSIDRWNPGVARSLQTSEGPVAEGATRRCDLGRRDYLDEEVVEWEPRRALTMRITGTNLPFASADIRFTLEQSAMGDGATVVEVTPVYALKFGPLGKLLDAIFVSRVYQKGMRELLQGLKRHAEKRGPILVSC